MAKDVFNRYALWTYTNCDVLSDTTAVHFWEVVQFSSGVDAISRGTTMAVYNLDPDGSELTVTREDQFLLHGRALEYFDAASGEWSSTQPSPSERDASAAKHLFSEYHNQYLLVFFNNWINNMFRVLSAPTPVGPWTTDNKVIFEAPEGKSYNYGAQSTPVYYQTDGETGGKNLMLAYTYQDFLSKYPKAMKLKFE
ncbi:hypothetical protein V1517DRAFT_359620 [Lipomyces orientalis]|uniref:Uncharacterized protein n=1 Tax=Lipomyces orientalis TaxID=1233043 RepID=A0ACC3TDB1_9ASCO